MKHVKESTMSDEIANKDIENTAKNVKSSEEATEVVKEIEKNYQKQQVQYFMACLSKISNI